MELADRNHRDAGRQVADQHQPPALASRRGYQDVADLHVVRGFEDRLAARRTKRFERQRPSPFAIRRFFERNLAAHAVYPVLFQMHVTEAVSEFRESRRRIFPLVNLLC